MSAEQSDPTANHVLTLIAAREATVLTPDAVATVRDAVSASGPTVTLSPGEAVDLHGVAACGLDAARAALAGAAIDVLLTPATGRRKRVLVADMDSTIVTAETLDELAAYAGLGEQVAAITQASMNGQIDFREALRARVAMLKGLPVAALEATWAGVRLTPGAGTLVATMRAHGATTALVSGGFTFFTARVAALCGFDHHRANRLLEHDGALSGQVGEPILDRDAKLAALRELAAAQGLDEASCLAVGDGANDLAMLRHAGLGIAFRARPVVAAQVANRVDHGDLRGLLFAQGFAATEFVQP